MQQVSVADVGIRRYNGAIAEDTRDHLAVEEPLELHIEHGPTGDRSRQAVSVTMRTPGNDAELSTGFLFTEGIISSPNTVASTKEAFLGENTILVSLTEDTVPVLSKADRNFYTTSSCGVCGKASIDAIKTASPFPLIPDDISIPAAIFQALPDRLRVEQSIFNNTGGLHASALFSINGDFIALREDVGRHNALDKLIGAAFIQDNLPLRNVILLLSGRASFELVQKAAMAGIRVIAAVGAPSSLAVQLAAEEGITLIGFLRGQRFNIYTHSHRINL
jgi:FdhD protein